jgi:hypothetical protein
MNFRTTLGLLAIVGVAAVVWMLLPKSPTQPTADRRSDAAVEPTRYVLDPRPEENDVVRVQVEAAGKPRLTAERKSAAGKVEDWLLLEPVSMPAENYMVNALVSAFTRLEVRSTHAPADLSESQAGLAPPAARVTLADTKGTQYVFEVGRKAPLSSDTYVRLAGQPTIYQAAGDLGQVLGKEMSEYRSKNLGRVAVNDIVHLTILHDGKTYDFGRTSDSRDWSIESPIRALADADKMRLFAGRAVGLRVTGVTDDQPASLEPYGLDQPFLQVSITTEIAPAPRDPEAAASQPPPQPERHTLALLVGNYADMQKENRFVKLADQPWVGTIPAASAEAFLPKLEELRDPRVTRMLEAEVTKLELTAAGQYAVLERREGVWHGEDDLSEVDQEAVRELLQAAADLRAVQFEDGPGPPAEYGLDHPRAVLTFTRAGYESPTTLHIGSDTPSGRNVFVRVEGRPSVQVVRQAAVARLVTPPLALRSRDIFHYEPDQISAVSVERPDRRVQAQRADGGWAMREPPEASVDETSIREMTHDLARLRGKRVVARDAAAAYGLAQPHTTVRFTAMPAPRADDVEVGPPMPRQHAVHVSRRENAAYCRVDDNPYVFELDETVYRVLTQELIDRQVWTLAPEDIVRLSVEATGGSIEFVRDGGTWKYAPDPTVQIVQPKIQEMVNDLARLRTEAYVIYADADLAAAGLSHAPATVTLHLKDGSIRTLKLDQVQKGEVPRLAGWVEQRRVFLLRPGDADRLMRGLDEYLTPDAPAQAVGAGSAPPRPGMAPGAPAPPPGFSPPSVVPR